MNGNDLLEFHTLVFVVDGDNITLGAMQRCELRRFERPHRNWSLLAFRTSTASCLRVIELMLVDI